MVDLKIIEGGREQMGREALSAVLTGDDAKVEELLRIMRPINPRLAAITGGDNKELMPDQPIPTHLSPDP